MGVRSSASIRFRFVSDLEQDTAREFPKGPRMAKSFAFAADASRLAALLLSYIPVVCAFVAPCQPGASTTIIDRLSIRGPYTASQLNGPVNFWTSSE